MQATEGQKQKMREYYLKVRRKKMGYIKYKRRWEKSEIGKLKELYDKDLSAIELSKIIDRTPSSIRSMANLLHLYKSFESKSRMLSRNHKGVNKGSLNGVWAGDNVGYDALHAWVKRNKPKQILCEKCKENKPLELANVSGNYLRDVNDYKWLCRSCHMHNDGRILNLKVGGQFAII